jgi:phosphoglycolate phosphatase-like HAD superfamily hydrolase
MGKIRAHQDQTVYVGDHPNDIKAARSASSRTAAAKWGSMHKSELEDLKPDFIFKHPFQALTLSDSRS